jgi:hypothetical protein
MNGIGARRYGATDQQDASRFFMAVEWQGRKCPDRVKQRRSHASCAEQVATRDGCDDLSGLRTEENRISSNDFDDLAIIFFI